MRMFLVYYLSLLGMMIGTHGYGEEYRVVGYEFLEGIRDIIGVDPNISPQEVEIKPFVGSFSNLNPTDDVSQVSYCLTDNACGHFEAYQRKDIPLSLLSCNHFCYIDKETHMYRTSEVYGIDDPPLFYLNCGWETCG